MILQNDRLRVEIADHGAELRSIFDLRRNAELLWNGDPTFWSRRSPILFPYVGKTWQGTVLIDGQQYHPTAHGFARDRDFTLESSDGQSAVFLLRSDEATRKVYPFDFELRCGYRLEDGVLHVSWRVTNLSDREMPFTIGGHPAFCFSSPANRKEAYQLKFDLSGGKDELCCTPLDLATGTTKAGHEIVPLSGGVLPLSESLFVGDTLIMDGGQVLGVDLCRKDGSVLIGVRCEDFPNFGVWSMPNAPYVCLEPWMGRCDSLGFDKEFREKPNVNLAAPGETFEASYEIRIP